MSAAAMLTATLEVAVPMWISRLAPLTDAERDTRRRVCVDAITATSDQILFRGPDTAEAFNRLAEGLALAAFAPGGVHFAGLHFTAQESPNE